MTHRVMHQIAVKAAGDRLFSQLFDALGDYKSMSGRTPSHVVRDIYLGFERNVNAAVDASNIYKMDIWYVDPLSELGLSVTVAQSLIGICSHSRMI